jgi:hypothetical protein
MMGTLPLLVFGTWFFVWNQQNYQKKTQNVYSQAGALAEQALSSIRTVKALCGEDYEF